MKYVVDTNVAVIANGNDTNASFECRLSTIDFLEKMISSGRLVVDLAGEVEEEYRRNLSAGQPGVGNRFIQAFLTAGSGRLLRIEVKKKTDGSFIDFPIGPSLRKFDRSDRKFAALARKARCPIANAADSDWLDHKNAIEASGVKIEFLCSCDRSKWFK